MEEEDTGTGKMRETRGMDREEEVRGKGSDDDGWDRSWWKGEEMESRRRDKERWTRGSGEVKRGYE